MNDLWLIASIAIPVLVVVVAIYAISTRGLKGAMFGDRITSSDELVIKYRLRAIRHTMQLHKMGLTTFMPLKLADGWQFPERLRQFSFHVKTCYNLEIRSLSLSMRLKISVWPQFGT